MHESCDCDEVSTLKVVLHNETRRYERLNERYIELQRRWQERGAELSGLLLRHGELMQLVRSLRSKKVSRRHKT